MKFIDKIKGLISYAPVLCFLVLEIIAFTIFSFGDSFLLYSILATIALVLIVFISFYQYKKWNIITYVAFIIPLLAYTILIVTCRYSVTLDTATRVFVPFAFVSFATLGFLLSGFKSFKLKHLLYVIYGVLALITFLNLIMTLIEYGPFYGIKYANYYTYFNGEKSRVSLSGTAYGLIGFSYQKITVEYFCLYPSLLLTSVIALFFISPKKDRTQFLIFLGFSVLAFISLLFTASKIMLTGDLITIVTITVFILFAKIKKLWCETSYVILLTILGFFVLFLIFFICNANGVGWVKNITTSNKALNYVFNTNKLSVAYNDILKGILSLDKVIGFAPYMIYDVPERMVYPSGNWLFDQFMYGGICAFVFFLMYGIYSFASMWKFKSSTKGSKLEKILLLSLICVYFGYTFTNGSVLRMVNYSDLLPLFTSGPFLVILFLLSYTIGSSQLELDYEK